MTGLILGPRLADRHLAWPDFEAVRPHASSTQTCERVEACAIAYSAFVSFIAIGAQHFRVGETPT